MALAYLSGLKHLFEVNDVSMANVLEDRDFPVNQLHNLLTLNLKQTSYQHQSFTGADLSEYWLGQHYSGEGLHVVLVPTTEAEDTVVFAVPF